MANSGKGWGMNRSIVLSGVILLTCCPPTWAGPDAPVSRVIDGKLEMTMVGPSSVVAGQPYEVTVSVTNRSGRTLRLLPTGDVSKDIRVSVTDSFGRPVERTKYGSSFRCAKYPPTEYKIFKPRALPAGKTWSATINLSLIFDLSLPREYIASAEMSVFADGADKPLKMLVVPGLHFRVTKQTVSAAVKKAGVSDVPANVAFLPHKYKSLGEDLNLLLESNNSDWTFVDNTCRKVFSLPRAKNEDEHVFLPVGSGLAARYRWVRTGKKTEIELTVYDRQGKEVSRIRTDRWNLTVYGKLDLAISHGAHLLAEGKDTGFSSFRAYRLSTGKGLQSDLPAGMYRLSRLAPVSGEKGFTLIVGPALAERGAARDRMELRVLRFDRNARKKEEHLLKIDSLAKDWGAVRVAFWPDRAIGVYGPQVTKDRLLWHAFDYQVGAGKLNVRSVDGFTERLLSCFAAKERILLFDQHSVALFDPDGTWYDHRRPYSKWDYFVQMRLHRRTWPDRAAVAKDGRVAVLIGTGQTLPQHIFVITPDRKVQQVISIRPIVGEMKFSADGSSLLLLGYDYTARAKLLQPKTKKTTLPQGSSGPKNTGRKNNPR